MADRLTTLQKLIDTGVIAVIRADSGDQLVNVCRALSAGGVQACEITMTTPGALDAIAQASRELGKSALIGAGSVLDAETARAAILAGARFIFSPILNLDVIAMAHRYDCVAVPGAMTPTEIATAWTAGADVVKVFPANHFGPQYLRDIHGPLPQVKLTPTGGVDLNTAADWIKAGAVAIGVGSSLVKKELINAANWDGLSSLAKQYVDIVAAARRG
ncbi:bifunctional 4-hydroxy-2-oxoglutarate aldolase/2-dehydro-3-deoxy-phosphogluconate aldolase [Lacipirellula sp.]|uniref:bifunctional 4-hydroxy-2-oxoglutarate aldolase/2-dehydro-3-deoxy-phosphogluconate aldolase n=1 Tax=Lacipirellula sp. TaxID=2691419 RepID=UPI003D0DDD9D